MSDIEPQQANHFPRDTFSPPSLHNHGSHGAQIFHAANNDNDQLGDKWGDVPLATRKGMQGRVDPHHISAATGNHGMTVYHRLPVDPTVPYTYPNPQGFPGHEQVILPENQGNNLLCYGPHWQDVVPDPNQLAFLNPPVQQVPAPDQPVAENLRRLASRYVHHPDSQVNLVRMEPGPAGRYRVVIVLEISDFL